MDPRHNKIVYFHVVDTCNFRCTNCHWFSNPIVARKPSYTVNDLVQFMARTGPYDRTVFSGGEPTLWHALPEAVNNLPASSGQVAIYTNASSPSRLRLITKQDVYLRLSVHAETRWDLLLETIGVARERGWEFKLYGYTTDFGEATVPPGFPYAIKVKPDQVSVAHDFDFLVGHTVRCRPRMVFIATDGNAYTCEKGIRSKTPDLREDFSIWDGQPHLDPRTCRADEACLSCFLTEQFVVADDVEVPNEFCEPGLNPYG